MRIWSLHPKYLDVRGLTACWRETLLAQKVLLGQTAGYRKHPQLVRFRLCPNPAASVAAYLEGIWEEANQRGYAFDRSKIWIERDFTPVAVTEGQLLYEWEHLMNKLRRRDPARGERLEKIELPEAHPLFVIVPGEVAAWEVVPFSHRS